MGWLTRVFGIYDGPGSASSVRAALSESTVTPQLLELIRYGGVSSDALRNSAVNRCVLLIERAMGQLPLGLQELDSNGDPAGTARDHWLHKLLSRQPRRGQTPFTFKAVMQRHALMKGNAYALPIRSLNRVSELIILPPHMVKTVQRDDWSIEHEVRGKSGGVKTFKAGELLHLMGPSDDGITGRPMVDYARDVIDMARSSDAAMKSSMNHGANPGGALEFPDGKSLTPEAHDRLRMSVDNDFSGEKSGRWMILEQGLKANVFDFNSRNAQGVELRQQLVEEVGRMFGVPRPFLMLDDTSWGSGIEQLSMMLVQYTLAPWFVSWEQAITVSLLTENERDRYRPKFNEKALLRGTMKDQAEFLSKLTGAGGTPQIMQQNESRGALELPPLADGYGLANPMRGNSNAPA